MCDISNLNVTEMNPSLAGVKLDIIGKKASDADSVTNVPVVPPHPSSAGGTTHTRTPSAKTRATSASVPVIKTPATVKTYEIALQPLVSFINLLYLEFYIPEFI